VFARGPLPLKGTPVNRRGLATSRPAALRTEKNLPTWEIPNTRLLRGEKTEGRPRNHGERSEGGPFPMSKIELKVNLLKHPSLEKEINPPTTVFEETSVEKITHVHRPWTKVKSNNKKTLKHPLLRSGWVQPGSKPHQTRPPKRKKGPKTQGRGVTKPLNATKKIISTSNKSTLGLQ